MFDPLSVNFNTYGYDFGNFIESYIPLVANKCNANDAWLCAGYYNMTVWILAQNDINFSMAAGLIRLHMPGVK